MVLRLVRGLRGLPPLRYECRKRHKVLGARHGQSGLLKDSLQKLPRTLLCVEADRILVGSIHYRRLPLGGGEVCFRLIHPSRLRSVIQHDSLCHDIPQEPVSRCQTLRELLRLANQHVQWTPLIQKATDRDRLLHASARVLHHQEQVHVALGSGTTGGL